ncbi:hypothetical protein BV20DRAFT_1048035 [Pilatotrama ljubarskyi]|nr:hypothetical protein BV20DRAFT_1048035 [Pilatotrama ljubarskyi]
MNQENECQHEAVVQATHETKWPVRYDHESALTHAQAGTQTLRVILFPADEDSPKLAYTECRVQSDPRVPGRKNHLLDFASLLQVSGDGVGATAIPAGRLEPSPPATRLYLAFDSNAARDDTPLNHAAGCTPVKWRGTLLGFRAYEPADQLTQYMDVWAHDIRTFATFLRTYRGPLEGRPLVRRVEEVVIEASGPVAETKDNLPSQSSSKTDDTRASSTAQVPESGPESAGDPQPAAPPNISSEAAKDDKEASKEVAPLAHQSIPVTFRTALEAASTLQKRPMRSLWSIAASAGAFLSSSYVAPSSGRRT